MSAFPCKRKTMCCSGKYPHPPIEFQITFQGVGMDIFWNSAHWPFCMVRKCLYSFLRMQMVIT